MRQGLLLYHVEGLMATELAEVLDKPVYDIPPLLDRARKDYRECLIAAGCRLKHEPGQKP
jgi:DNA-directed RNA polymerase specialized sigma24 family protein